MKTIWLEDIESFKKISSDWDRALLFSGEDNPFLFSGFLLAWWKHYFLNLEPRIFVVYDGDKLIGGLPLCLSRRGTLECFGGITANYTEFLAVAPNRPLLWKTFLEALTQRHDWKRLYLRRYRESRLDANILNGLLSKHSSIYSDIYDSGYTYLRKIPDKFDSYISCLSPTLRRYVRYAEKCLSESGELHLKHLSAADNLEEWCDAYIGLSGESFKKRRKESSFRNQRYCLYFKDLLRSFQRAGYLDANILKLNDNIIAMHFGYSLFNNLNWVFPVFNAKFSRFHPGHLLIYKLIELGSSRRNGIFDFYPGYSLYKEQWSTEKERVCVIELRRATFSGKLERAAVKSLKASVVLRKTGGIIRRSSVLTRAAKKIKELLA